MISSFLESIHFSGQIMYNNAVASARNGELPASGESPNLEFSQEHYKAAIKEQKETEVQEFESGIASWGERFPKGSSGHSQQRRFG